jgi:glycosyltransferase involved in cell wall biosynthesis
VNKYNVAIITTVHSALDGRIFYKEAVSLRESGYDVTIFAPSNSCEEEEALKLKRIRFVPLKKAKLFRNRLSVWWQLMNLLRQSPFAVWHIHDPELLPLSIVWRFLFSKNTKIVHDVHEEYLEDLKNKYWLPVWTRFFAGFIIDWVEKVFIRRCSLVISATDKIDDRNRCLSKNTIVVKNYPLVRDITSYNQSLNSDNKVYKLIYVGGVSKPRGIHNLVNALDDLSDLPIELHLLGPIFPSFEKELNSLSRNNLFIHPPVSFDDVGSYLSSCHIGLVCLEPLPGYINSLPVKLFEYMEFGLAVIASDFPLWRQIVTDSNCGLLVDPQSSQSIAHAIRHLVENPNLMSEMGFSGRNAVSSVFSWNHQSQLLINAYAKML